MQELAGILSTKKGDSTAEYDVRHPAVIVVDGMEMLLIESIRVQGILVI